MSSKPAKKRLDVLLVERGMAESRQRAQAWILAGQVLVRDEPITKAGTKLPEDVPIRLREGTVQRFVSRGGLKLEGALKDFPQVQVEGRVCADLGASTGGFTDCLLQQGAAKVYAIDVGYGQLAWKLRQDTRVVVMERTNARHLESLPEPIELIVGDLSFISLTKVLPAIQRLAAPGADCVLLVKPQFEVGKGQLGKGGVVRDEEARQLALAGVVAEADAMGFGSHGSTTSPITGAKGGNVEYLVHLSTPT